jgi:hypothetical protein
MIDERETLKKALELSISTPPVLLLRSSGKDRDQF